MKNLNHSLKATLVALTFCAATLGHAGSSNDSYAWTTIGAAGTPNREAQERVITRGASVRLAPQAALGSAIIRYNITATPALVDGMPGSAGAFRLDVDMTDSGSDARVRVFLNEKPLDGSPPRVLHVIDSDQQESVEAAEMSGLQFDFQKNAYFLAVVLTKYAEGEGAAFNGASLIPIAD